MKLKKLNLTNFRSHPDTTLDHLPRLVVVRGANHSGKTSLVHAIELALAGRADPTDARGAGAKDLIRTGADGGKAIVKLRLQNDPTVEEFRDIRCSLTAASGRTVAVSNPADKEAKGDDFAYWLNSQRDTLSCLINGRYFVGLPEKEQKALLAGIVLPEQYSEWDSEMVARIHELKLKFNAAAKPFDEIASVYKQAFDERRDLNRDIRNHTIPEGDTTLAGDIAELESKLSELQSEKNRINVALAEVGNARSAHRARLASLQESLAKANTRLSSEQQQVEAFKRAMLSKALLKEKQTLAETKPRAVELDREITRVQTLLDEAKAAYEKVQELDRAGNCPRCRQPISEETFAGIAKSVAESRNQLGEKVANLRDERKLIGDYEGAAREIARHEQARLDLKRSEERVVEAHKEISGLNAQIDGLGPEPVASSELEESLAEATRKHQEIAERIAPVATANALKQQKEAARAKSQAMQLKLSKLEQLVQYFGPGDGGIQARLLSEHVGAFQQSMNKVLANWGYACSLNFEPYVFGIRRGETTLPLHILSESEKHQFAIAFQVALAIHSGLRFAVVDASEIYDAAGRKQMFSALLNAGLDQVIVLGTDERVEVPANQDEKGLAYYRFAAEKVDHIVTTTVSRLLPAA